MLSDGFVSTWEKATQIASELKVLINSHHLLTFKEPTLPRNSSFSNVRDFYRTILYDDGINRAISELEARFEKEHQNLLSNQSGNAAPDRS